ncbi:MAG TPA: DUF881 domain-containing protein [Nocardioidaceae bacterium]|nr:DUF881 domain-containing protein [Nocardioidaceae bacterium]
MDEPDRPRASISAWRLLVPLVFAVAGVLFVTSAESADGGQLRADNATSLTGLVQSERDDVDALREQTAELNEQIELLSSSVSSTSLTKLESQVAELQRSAGVVQLEGPAVKVTLDDAPYDQEVPEGFTANDLVVHQQDLQAVVNALWRGGAEGITLQGQRIVATTGIKCVGNTVLLQGVPYSPPYEIVAVGDTTEMVSAINSADYIDIYKQYTEPPVNIGWEVDVLDQATLPAYEVNIDLEYAEAAR